MEKQLIVAVDFDGTCVTHDYPRVGHTVPLAVAVLKALVASGFGIILYTMRSGTSLADAVSWFSDHDIPLLAVNNNPTQHTWTKSPKIYAHAYIDDAAIGAPLMYPVNGDRPYVDWAKVFDLMTKQFPHIAESSSVLVSYVTWCLALRKQESVRHPALPAWSKSMEGIESSSLPDGLNAVTFELNFLGS